LFLLELLLLFEVHELLQILTSLLISTGLHFDVSLQLFDLSFEFLLFLFYLYHFIFVAIDRLLYTRRLFVILDQLIFYGILFSSDPADEFLKQALILVERLDSYFCTWLRMRFKNLSSHR